MNGLIAPDEFTTARLRLRKPRLGDAAPLFQAYASDREATRFVSWRTHESETETRDFLQLCQAEWSSGSGHPYVIDAAGKPVGMIHLHKRPYRVEFGYVIARSCWGRGYMTEALTTLVDWSLGQAEIWRASAFCDADNIGSARVMEKAGMAFEGVMRRYFVHPNLSPEPRDCKLFAKVRL